MEVIAHPEGVAAGLASEAARAHLDVAPDAVEHVVTRSVNLSAEDRLGIYANAYYWRLLDILAQEFPTVRHVLGPPRFGEVATAYLVAHPSRSYTLYELGRKFPAFLANEAVDLPHRALLADVATVERAIEDVFNAPRASAVSLDDLLAIPMDAWPRARFRFVPATGLFALSTKASDLIASVREETHMDLPEPQPTWLLVVRRDFKVWRYPQSEAQHAVLARLAAGECLGDALEAALAVPGTTDEALLGSLGGWFQDWMGYGTFASVAVE